MNRDALTSDRIFPSLFGAWGDAAFSGSLLLRIRHGARIPQSCSKRVVGGWDAHFTALAVGVAVPEAVARRLQSRGMSMTPSKRVRSVSYLSTVHHCPSLSREREHDLAVRWHRHGDISARDLLIRAQLRHVVAIARQHRGRESTTLEELIAEGNFGLVHALAKFDPERGTRFATYAVFWIRAYILQYMVRSKSLVTTGVRSKAFSRLKRVRDEVRGSGAWDVDAEVATRLTLSPERLRSLTVRLNVCDVPWDAAADDARGLAETHATDELNVEDAVSAAEIRMQRSNVISEIVSRFDERERYIVEQRLMAHREDELSLAELGRHFRVSRERARQLEARVLRKLKAALLRSEIGADLELREQVALKPCAA